MENITLTLNAAIRTDAMPEFQTESENPNDCSITMYNERKGKNTERAEESLSGVAVV